jgi:6-phosphogluconolactonase (cycloisomerase 2 family)
VITQGELVFVGCYTEATGGAGQGITLMRREPSTGELTPVGVVARTPSPSFLARHPALPMLYAVNELDEGTVTAFSVAPDGTLTEVAVRSTGGAHPCHVAVTPDGRHLLAANYSSGSVSLHALDDAGHPGPHLDVLQLKGEGPDRDRQEGPHAHMVSPDPDGAGALIVDLGSDRVWHVRLDAERGLLTDPTPAVMTPPGTGPRHLRRLTDGTLLVVGELAADLSWHRGERAGVVAATAVDGVDYPSELVVGRGERFVYVANRGPDTVAAFAWDGSSATPVAEVPTGGAWPRHIALVDDHLYVANERSHSVTMFRIDPISGVPQRQGEAVVQPSPTCILCWDGATMHR